VARAQLEELNRIVEVLQPVLTEIDQLVLRAELAVRRSGDHDLASVPGRADPRGEVDVRPHIALARQPRRAGVDADPHLDGPAFEELAALTGGRQRVVGRRKHVEERVALCVDLGSVVSRERLSQDAPMLCENVCVGFAEPMKKLRRAFDVGEDEGQPAVGQLAHGTFRP
jgi:hypothetical protein